MVGTYISGAMWDALCSRDAMVRLPEGVHTQIRKIKGAARRLELSFGRQPSVDEIAREAGLSSDEVSCVRL